MFWNLTNIFLQQSVQSEANQSLFQASQVIYEVIRPWSCRVTNKPAKHSANWHVGKEHIN